MRVNYPALTSHFNFSRRVKSLSFVLLVSTNICCNFCFPQEKVATQALKNADVDAVAKLVRDFQSHMEQQSNLTESHERIAAVLLETEMEFNSLNLEVMQQESAARAASSRLMDLTPRTPPPQSRGQQEANRQEATSINLELAMRSEQVRQLSSAQQATVRRHLEAVNDAIMLRREIIAWRQKIDSFLESYWRFSDPEGIQTKAYNQQILEQWKLASDENVAAKIVQGLLEVRLGQSKEALETLNNAIGRETNWSAVAFAARSIVYSHRNEKQKAKQDLLAAYKLAPKNSYVLWLRAMHFTLQADYASAKKQFEILVVGQQHEIPARRMIAILAAIRPSKTERDLAKALQHARLASALTGSENWYSELVLAMSLHLTGDREEALTTAKRSRELAIDENVAICDQVIEWISADKPMDLNWKFYR
jgi:tetratricopeptide (TPR) repeat protein